MKATSKTNQPPSPKAGIFGGHFIKFRRRPTEFLEEAASLGDVTHFKMGGQSAYFLNHPDLIRDLLVVNADKFKRDALCKGQNVCSAKVF